MSGFSNYPVIQKRDKITTIPARSQDGKLLEINLLKNGRLCLFCGRFERKNRIKKRFYAVGILLVTFLRYEMVRFS